MVTLQRGMLVIAIAIGVTAATTSGFARAEQPSTGSAQGYPNKPVRLIVPFSPGGTSDVLARTIGMKLSESWGQPVVIETRTGAGGTIGTGLVAKATPDGYTVLISSAAFAISAAMHQNLPYDALKDFAGITRLGYSTVALIVPPALGASQPGISSRSRKPSPVRSSSAAPVSAARPT